MHTMRRIAAVLAIVAAVLPAPVKAAASGDILGVIHNESTGKPQAGARVTLLHAEEGKSEPETSSVVTDARGRYRFENLPTGDEHLYAIDARHQGGLFAGGTITLPDDTAQRPVVETRLKVWDTTDDPKSILLSRNDMFLVPKDNAVAVVDSYRIVNMSEEAYIGRGGAGANTTLGFPLPDSARGNGVVIVNQPRIDIPELRNTEFGFGITTAIPPGRTDIAFSYSVDGTGGSYDLTRTALYPILDSSVFAQEPLEVRSNRLEERGPEAVGGEEYVEWSTPSDLDAGDPLQILAVAQAGMSPLLFVGAAIGLGLIALALAAGVVLRRRASLRAVTAPASAEDPKQREELVVAIAELDLRYRDGGISEDEWRTRREELKARVEERAPEPAP